jgi:diaminopimelate epimerase
MGEPILEATKIPTLLAGNPPIEQTVSYEPGKSLNFTCVSMGNPHAVTFVDEITKKLVHGVGPLVEVHDVFPRKVNVEFVKVNSRTDAHMRVWERGSGETLACGTGACAVAVAGILTDRFDRKVTIHLLGGDLEIEWGVDNHVYKTGPAVEVFSGDWPL